MLPIVNLLRHLYWELKIETGNTCTMATFYNAPTRRPFKNQAIAQIAQKRRQISIPRKPSPQSFTQDKGCIFHIFIKYTPLTPFFASNLI